MRILFASLDAPGHVFPLCPLALALQDAGHEVIFASGAQLRPAIDGVGLDSAVAGLSMRDAFVSASPPGTDVRRLPPEERLEIQQRVFGEVLPKAFAADLLTIMDERRPELVVAELANTGAAIAAAVRDVPCVVHGFGRIEGAWPTDAAAVDDLAEQLGFTVPTRHDSALRLIDICPPSLQNADQPHGAHVWPLRPVPFADPAAGVPDVPGTGPLIYLTMGTAFGHAGLFRTALAGLADLGGRVLVAVGQAIDPADLGDLGPQVVVTRWVDQAAALAQAEVVVHHGGSGTTLAAAALGVPQAVWPQGADQFANADGVETAGIGLRVQVDHGDDLEVSRQLTAIAERLLTDEAIRAQARVVRAEVAAMPAPAGVAARLTEG